MPHYSTPLLSLLPASFDFKPSPLHHQRNLLDPAVLAAVKTVDFVGYAPYPAALKAAGRRNQVVASDGGKGGKGRVDVPMFRSEKERKDAKKKRDRIVSVRRFERLWQGEKGWRLMLCLLGGGQVDRTVEEELDAAQTPTHYRKVEIKYSRFGVEDFDFGFACFLLAASSLSLFLAILTYVRHSFYNKTPYSGLETHITNSYTNSLLQALHYTSPVRTLAESHTHSACAKENCLLCEAGFLFRMLGDAKGMNCQASNFSRAFSSSPQGAFSYLGGARPGLLTGLPLLQ